MNVQSKLAVLIVICGTLAACTNNYYVVPTPARAGAIATIADAASETVIVKFDATTSCPSGIAIVNADCPPGLAGPDTACREPANGHTVRLKVVRWVKDANAPAGKDFSIAFSRVDPCSSNVNSKVCSIKRDEDLPWNGNDMLITKYSINSEGCDVLDPYIIVMR